jgi:RNA polymerase sigma-70 factor (ECF subfamily)
VRAEVEEALETLHKKEPGNIDRALQLLQQTVFSFSMKLCGRREDAEDTMQETLLKTVSRLADFRSPKALGVWLYKVAKTQCLMSRRKSKFAPREELSLELLMPDRPEFQSRPSPEFPAPDAALLRKEQNEQLRHAILRLPPAFRLVLVLHDMEELSTEEVARVTGLREGTLRVRLHRARLFLRNQLSGAAPPPPSEPRRRVAPAGRCRELFRELSDYLDGELDASLCRELEEHLADCQSCRAFVKSLEQTVERLRSQQAPALNPRTAGKLRATVEAEYRRVLQESRNPRRKSAS